MNLKDAIIQARKIARDEGVVQHVNRIPGNRYNAESYEVDDFYDSDNTVISFEGNRVFNKEKSKVLDGVLKNLDESKLSLIKKLVKEELNKLKLNEFNSAENRLLHDASIDPEKIVVSNILDSWNAKDPFLIEQDLFLFLIQEYNNGDNISRYNQLKEYIQAAIKLADKWVEYEESTK